MLRRYSLTMSNETTGEPTNPEHKKLKYLPTRLAIHVIRFIGRRDHNTLLTIGRVLGFCAFHLAGRRRKVAATNIKLCFPELTAIEQKQLLRQTIFENVMGLIETARAWVGDLEDIQRRVIVEGEEHLHEAIAQGRGVLLVGAHYTTLDLGAAMMRMIAPMVVGYTPNKNPVFDQFMRDGRRRLSENAIDRNNMRGLVKVLKKGGVLWYAPDQDYGKDHSVFAPFFDVPAASVRMTPKLATLNNSAVVITSTHREPDDQHYRIRFSPIVENYPTGDDVADAARINSLLETEIRRSPAQYMWVHRRFKTTPEGQTSRYAES